MLHTVDETESNQTIRVHRGDTIEVQLDETPTSGYAWEIEALEGEVCSLVTSQYQMYAGAGIGGGGIRTMTFRVENAGSGKIKLKNWQRWSGDVYKRFEISVQAN